MAAGARHDSLEGMTHRSLPELALAAARHDGVALRVREGEAWADTSFADVAAAAVEVAAGLIELGVRRGDRVAVIGDTRPEWTLADLGALCAGAVVVPVYQTSSPEECRYVLAHADVRVAIVEDAKQLAKVERIRHDLPVLEHVVTMVPTAGVPSLRDLRERGAAAGDAAARAATEGLRAQDVATIVYTSGTTGPPKGCQLTHGNCLETVRMYRSQIELGPGDRLFTFLPLAHALARMVQFVALDSGATLAFWGRDPAHLLDDLAAARPTHFPSVPRVFEKVHAKACGQVEDGSALRRRLFGWALEMGAEMRAAERDGRVPGAGFTCATSSPTASSFRASAGCSAARSAWG